MQKSKLKNLIVAYEPVWAIGAEHPMSTHQMHEMAIYIRKILSEHFGKAGLTVPVLYGGAIDAASAPAMQEHGDVQGFLIGRAGTDVVKVKELFASLHA